METKKQNYVLPIVVMIFLFGMISFVTNLASPMGDILKYQFNVPNWMGTLGVFANFIAYAIMGYPAGNMLQKYGYKKTALVAIAVGFIGVGIQTLSGSAQSFGVYLLGAFIAGFSMCLLNTVVNPMLNKLGGGGNKGNQLIQAGGSFNSLCGTAVIILTGLLIPEGIKNAQISNVFPLMYAALAIFAFAFIVISLTKIPETNKEAGVKTAEASKYGPLSFRHFMLGAIAIFVYVGIEVGIPNVLQKWLQNPDLNVLGSGVNAEAVAGSVAATYWFLMLIGRLLGAAIGSKVSAKSMLTVVSSVGLLLTLGAMFAPEVAVNLPVFNDIMVFENPAVKQKIKNRGVVMLNVDWTVSNSETAEFMKKFGRSGLPFYVLFSPLVPDGMVLPEILSEQELKLLIDNMSLFRPNS